MAHFNGKFSLTEPTGSRDIDVVSEHVVLGRFARINPACSGVLDDFVCTSIALVGVGHRSCIPMRTRNQNGRDMFRGSHLTVDTRYQRPAGRNGHLADPCGPSAFASPPGLRTASRKETGRRAPPRPKWRVSPISFYSKTRLY